METKDLNAVHNDDMGKPIETDSRKWVAIVQVSDTEWGYRAVESTTLIARSFVDKETAIVAAYTAGYSVDDSMQEDRRGQ